MSCFVYNTLHGSGKLGFVGVLRSMRVPGEASQRKAPVLRVRSVLGAKFSTWFHYAILAKGD